MLLLCSTSCIHAVVHQKKPRGVRGFAGLVEAFKENIRTLFGLGDKVKVEFFERALPDADGGVRDVVQVMVYQEGLPDSYLAFEEEDQMVSHIRRPVSEHAITYAADSGVIEVVAAGRERRDRIASAFTESLLKWPVAEQVALRRYRLSRSCGKRPWIGTWRTASSRCTWPC